MKYQFFLLSLISLFAGAPMCKAQESYPRVNQYTGTLYMNQHDSYRKGDTVTLGSGTLPSGDFQFITKSLAKIPLSSSFNGQKARITSIRYQGNSKSGKKYTIVLTGAGVDGFEIDIENALASAEVISLDPDFKPAGIGKKVISVADEIRKLKALLDEGIITQQEFESQKKKLLE